MRQLSLKVCTIAAICCICSSSNADVVLTFDQSGIFNSVAVDRNYGDRVTDAIDGNGHAYDIITGNGLGNTPNVEVSYTGGSPDLWTTGYGDLENVLYDENDGSTGFGIVFTADPGYQVGIFEFDMASFLQDPTIPGVSILDSNNNVLWSSGSPVISGTTRTAFSTGGVFSNSLTLAVDLTGLGGSSDNIGIDNIQFGQRAIPEPSAMSLLLLGVAGSMLRRRRQRA